jgi:hypothetical protein
MELLTALRWINGATLLAALSMWLVAIALRWTLGFVKSAATTAWNTGVMFATAFQTNPKNPGVPEVPLDAILTVLTLALLWLSLFFPSRAGVLHGCAVAAALLMGWMLWTLRDSVLGLASLGALALWFTYYWAAAWRS